MEKLWGVWNLDEKIGQGSFGEVYKASKKELGQTFYAAIKHISLPKEQDDLEDIIREGYATTTEDIMAYYKDTIDDLVNETKIMYELRANKNIVDYQDHLIVEKEGKEVGFDIYIRMELLTSLDKYMKSHKLDEKEIVKLGLDIATALKICNKHDLLHRDIKPANIFIDDEGTYKLGDFGVARKLEKTTYGMSKKGTFNYMSPEIYKGEKASIASDIYSLGIVLYRLLNNNKAPFIDTKTGTVKASEAEQALMRRMNGEELPDIEGIDPVLMKIIKKACSFYHKDRYKKPEELIEDLQKYQDGKYKELEDALEKTVSIYGDDELEKTVSIYGDDILEKTVSIYGKQGNGYESDEELRERIKKIMSEEYNGQLKGTAEFVTIKTHTEKPKLFIAGIAFVLCLALAVYSLYMADSSRLQSLVNPRQLVYSYYKNITGIIVLTDLLVLVSYVMSLFSRRSQKASSYVYLINVILLFGNALYLKTKGVGISYPYMVFIIFNMILYFFHYGWKLGQKTIDIDKTQKEYYKKKDEKLDEVYSKPFRKVITIIISAISFILIIGISIIFANIRFSQSNGVDPSRKQIRIITDYINIRSEPSKYSSQVGRVYKDEIYTVLEERCSTTNDGCNEKFYKINTSYGVKGYIAISGLKDNSNEKEDFVVVISGGY